VAGTSVTAEGIVTRAAHQITAPKRDTSLQSRKPASTMCHGRPDLSSPLADGLSRFLARLLPGRVLLWVRLSRHQAAKTARLVDEHRSLAGGDFQQQQGREEEVGLHAVSGHGSKAMLIYKLW
jgi:hypothetical protein